MSSTSGSSPAAPQRPPTAPSTSPEQWPARGWSLRAPALPAAEHWRHAAGTLEPRELLETARHLAEPALEPGNFAPQALELRRWNAVEQGPQSAVERHGPLEPLDAVTRKAPPQPG